MNSKVIINSSRYRSGSVWSLLYVRFKHFCIKHRRRLQIAFNTLLKMLRSTSIVLLCLAVTLGWASPIGKVSKQVDPEINPDLFEGDILLPAGSESRGVIVDQSGLWPNGVVYYGIAEGQFSQQELDTLQEAFAQYEANSCLRFVRRTTEANYVYVFKSGGGCYSFIGMQGGLQRLSLDTNCFRCTATGCKAGTPIHEFLHAVGFFHEQSRTDRDDYVTINYDNIDPNYVNNFEKYDNNTMLLIDESPYDYGSVMHYGAYGFAIDPTVPTIITPNGEEIGQREGFSEFDLIELNNLYNCPKKNKIASAV